MGITESQAKRQRSSTEKGLVDSGCPELCTGGRDVKWEKSPVSEQQSGTVTGVEGAQRPNSTSAGDGGISGRDHREDFGM